MRIELMMMVVMLVMLQMSCQDVFACIEQGDSSCLLKHIQSEEGIDSVRNARGKTPLMESVLQEQVELVELILAHNVSLNEEDEEGKTALDMAFLAFQNNGSVKGAEMGIRISQKGGITGRYGFTVVQSFFRHMWHVILASFAIMIVIMALSYFRQ